MATGTRTSVEVKVKAADAKLKVRRNAVAQRVLDYFGDDLPTSRLLCFLDDEDTPDIKSTYGIANRGLYGPIHDTTALGIFRHYVTDCILVSDGFSAPFPRVFDDVIYLHGSTCVDDVGLTMTLAHELQHVIQHSRSRKIWAVNSLIPNLNTITVQVINLTWPDIPTEREARVVSKRVAVHLFGEQQVVEYIDKRIAAKLTEPDVADWQYLQSLEPSSSVDLAAETRRLFGRLRNCREEIENLLAEKKLANEPEFMDIDLDAYFA